jgi:fumarate hydratase subunit beta/L(+)-tartrate dehydratase beta subunit
MAEHHLTTPITDEDVKGLALGDGVYITGTVFSSRDMGHLEMLKIVEAGGELPEDLNGAVVFHAGPVAMRDGDGWRLVVIGPTTSTRMEPHAEFVAGLGVKLIIGKGGMFDGSRKAFREHTQAYLQAAPGCAALLASGVKGIRDVHWLELGMPEAMWVMDVEEFGPFIVTMDCSGGSTYADVRAAGAAAIAALGY